MRYAIGVDLGGTNIAVGLVDENWRIVDKANLPTLAPRPAEEIVADMARLTRELSARNLVVPVGVGIGAPGIISDGIIHAAANLKFREEPIRAMMEKAGYEPLTGGVYDTFGHWVEQAITRDIVLAKYTGK